MTYRSDPALSRRAFVGGATAIAATGLAAPAMALTSGFTPYTKAAFDAAMKGSKPVLVHVHASWCPTCKKQESVFNELSGSSDFKKLTAFVVDFDKEADFKKAHNITVQSVILVFKNGKEFARSGGVTDKTRIAAIVAEAAA
jgi:thiol-disulfide isomerase/thioredoxin